MIDKIWFIFLLYISKSSQEILDDKDTKNITTSLGLVTIPHLNQKEGIICRGCGSQLTAAVDIISKRSSVAQNSFYDSIFDEEKILVQVLPSEFLFSVPIITTKRSSCVGVGEWEEKDTWFPGYFWKPCVCPDCGTYVGWIFKPKDSSIVEPSERFFSLILSSVIGESCKYDTFIGGWFMGLDCVS